MIETIYFSETFVSTNQTIQDDRNMNRLRVTGNRVPRRNTGTERWKIDGGSEKMVIGNSVIYVYHQIYVQGYYK
jgi:hypothetical protein